MAGPQRCTTTIRCPHCAERLFEMYHDDGSRTADSAPLKEDEHGMYSVCQNPQCKRQVRMVQGPPGVWTVAPDYR
jgi:hypothetical protein